MDWTEHLPQVTRTLTATTDKAQQQGRALAHVAAHADRHGQAVIVWRELRALLGLPRQKALRLLKTLAATSASSRGALLTVLDEGELTSPDGDTEAVITVQLVPYGWLQPDPALADDAPDDPEDHRPPGLRHGGSHYQPLVEYETPRRIITREEAYAQAGLGHTAAQRERNRAGIAKARAILAGEEPPA